MLSSSLHTSISSSGRVFTHDYMTSFNKFEETQLLSQEAFFSDLSDEPCSDEDYNHAKRVFKEFNLKNLGEYHNLYLKTDVLLLADVFENFRKTCLLYYKLDPLHYFSVPEMTWDAMLKMPKVFFPSSQTKTCTSSLRKACEVALLILPNSTPRRTILE